MNNMSLPLRQIATSLFSFLLLFSAAAYAQGSSEANGGSSYSYFGVGTPVEAISDNFKSHGVFGISGKSIEVMSLANPALWSRAFYTEGNTRLELTQHELSSDNASSTNQSLQPGYIQVMLPMSKGKVGLSVSLYPVTSSNYQSQETQVLPVGNDTLGYTNTVNGSGGVNKFEMGVGFKINENISVGYAPSIAFLTLRNTELLSFSRSIAPQQQNFSASGAAFSQRIGIAAKYENLFRSEDRFYFGATFNMPVRIGVKREYTTSKNVEGQTRQVDLTSTLQNTGGEIELPMEVGFGLGYAPTQFFSFAFEGIYQNWSQYSSQIDPADALLMTDRTKIGAGGQFHPYKRNSERFFSRFKYSGGVSYDSGHLSIQGNDIETLWLSAGLGIITRTASSLDFSFQYGFRGTTSNNLIEERVWSLGMTVNLSELMFIRRKLR